MEGDEGVAEPGEETRDPLPSPQAYSIEVLPMIIENQRQHGLRHNDYLRYRQYCTRRIRRLRKALSYTQGKHRFSKKPVTLEKVLTDSRFLHLSLMEAERAWACAMHDKQRSQDNPRGVFHMMSRLKKAVKHATEFDRLVRESNRCDPRTQLESTAYASWMSATHQLERRQWNEAMRNFAQVKLIYEKLRNIAASLHTSTASSSKAAKSSAQRVSVEEDISGMYAQRMEEIEANVRYCAYSIQGAGGNVKDLLDLKSHLDSSSSAAMELLAEKLESVLALTREQKDDAVEITWRGQSVPVKSEKLRALLLRAKDKEYELTQSREADDGNMKLYDEVLAVYTEASSLLAEDIRATEKATATIQSQKNELLLQQLTFLSAYVTSLRLERANERFLRMIQRTKKALSSSSSSSSSSSATAAAPGSGASAGGSGKDKDKGSRPDDLVRLFDLVIQNLTDLADLEFNRDDADFVKVTSAKIVAYRAMRCFYVAEGYRTSGKFSEALALYQRTVEHAVAAKSQFASCPPGSISASAVSSSPSSSAPASPLPSTFVDELDSLVKEVRANKCQLHAAALLAQAEEEKGDGAKDQKSESDTVGNKALYDSLDTYAVSSEALLAKPHFVAFPPEFTPISCKPLFFDLASHHITFPSLKERTAQRSVVGSVLKSVTGWFGGSSKS